MKLCLYCYIYFAYIYENGSWMAEIKSGYRLTSKVYELNIDLEIFHKNSESQSECAKKSKLFHLILKNEKIIFCNF
jgi:hypothetical protein